MPLYEYECKACETRFERMQPVTDPAITECANCGSGPVRRVFHPVGVIFKGSGWYITDSRKSSPASKSDSSDKSDKSDSSTSSSEPAASSGSSTSEDA
jgi:putative FmdB family regulatory protein